MNEKNNNLVVVGCGSSAVGNHKSGLTKASAVGNHKKGGLTEASNTSIIHYLIMSSNQLRGYTNVTLHTYYANRAMNGRIEKEGRSAIPSLFQFNAQAKIVFSACEQDDPFAWWVLSRIEKHIEKIEKTLNESIEEVDQVLNQNNDRIEIEETHALKPETYPANVSGYGFKMLDMITLFDRLCCKVLGATHRCRLSQQDGIHMMSQGSSLLRKGMSVTHGYGYSGVTRKDILDKNKRATTALAKMIKVGLVDMNQFNGEDDMLAFFASYEPKTRYGPNVVRTDQKPNPAPEDEK